MGNNRALYGCPKEFKYYKADAEGIICGRGLREIIQRHCTKAGITLEIEDRTSQGKTKLKGKIILRDYQEGISEEIVKHKEGVVRLGTGFGKTIIALKAIELLQERALILVPRKHIQAQFLNEIKTYYGFDAGTDIKSDTDAPIVVSTIQSAQRYVVRTVRAGVAEMGRRFGILIVDECHTAVPAKSRAVVEAFAPHFIYGLTATARRTDEQGRAIFFTFGEILVDRDLPRKAPSVNVIPYYGNIPVWDYPGIIERQIGDPIRNGTIAGIVEREARAGRKVLVLTKRIAHYEMLFAAIRANLLSSGIGGDGNSGSNSVIALRSEGSAKSRAAELDSLRSGSRDFSVLLGTFSLLSTGVDIPSLDTLLIAGDLKSDVLTEQSTGRILRLFEGKPDPRIIDIADYGNHILKRQAKLREKFYNQLGWPVTYAGRTNQTLV